MQNSIRNLGPILAGVLAGACFVSQQAVNARLRTGLGSSYWAAFISYAGGTVAMLIVILFARDRLPVAAELGAAPWWAWLGGAFGAIYIVAAILLPRIGAAATISAIVLGQMMTSLIYDQTGALGVRIQPVSISRIAGIALMIAGMMLVRR